MPRKKKKVDLQGIPDGAKLWKIGDDWTLIYEVEMPGKKVPIRMRWNIVDEQELIRIYGTKKKAEQNLARTITPRQAKSLGLYNAGTSEALQDLGNHPWVQFREEYRKELKLRPWLANREMLQIALEAFAEGRQPTDAEVKNTEWYRSRNDAQRQWLELVNSKPSDAAQLIQDNRVRVGQWIQEAGISNLNERAVNYLVNRFSHGDWSEEETKSQILNLADARAPGGLHDPLARLAGGEKIRTHKGENKVRELFRTYLGPALGNRDYDTIKNWASKIRNDPNAEEVLTNHLRRQFRAQFGETYSDDDLTYEDIASPWRAIGSEILGQTVDETSDEFLRVLRANDATVARQTFIDYGLSRGNRKVENDVFAAMDQGLGGQVLNIGEAV